MGASITVLSPGVVLDCCHNRSNVPGYAARVGVIAWMGGLDNSDVQESNQDLAEWDGGLGLRGPEVSSTKS